MRETYSKLSVILAAITITFLGGCARTRPVLHMKPLQPLTNQTATTSVTNRSLNTTLRFKVFTEQEWYALCPRSDIRPKAGTVVPVQVSLENNGMVPANFMMEQQPYTPYAYNEVVTLIHKSWNPAGECLLAASTIGGLTIINAMTYDGLLSIHSTADVIALPLVILASPFYGVTIGAIVTFPLFAGFLAGTFIIGDMVHVQEYPSSVAENIITIGLTALPNQTVDGLMFLDASNSAPTLNLLKKSVIS